MSEIEMAWVAGLLEGEGSFTLGAFGGRTTGKRIQQIQVTCGMTDRDTIEKLHQTVGFGNLYLEKRLDPRRSHAKQMYIWQASKRADVVDFLLLIKAHMSARRTERIEMILQYAKDNPLIYGIHKEHGDYTSYRRGCKCDLCMVTGRAYNREKARRAREREKSKNSSE